jgi:hypothetical protein
MQGKLQRVCTPCILDGGGAWSLLPRLLELRQKLQRFGDATSDSSSDQVVLPAQLLSQCEAAMDPLSEKFAEVLSQATTAKTTLDQIMDKDMEVARYRCEYEVLQSQLQEVQANHEMAVLRWQAEAEDAERERRARAIADARAENAERDARDKQSASNNAASVGMALMDEEIAQERSSRQELESKLRESMEGLRRLECMLHEAAQAVATSKEASVDAHGPPAEEKVAACSAALLQLRRRSGSLHAQAPDAQPAKVVASTETLPKHAEAAGESNLNVETPSTEDQAFFIGSFPMGAVDEIDDAENTPSSKWSNSKEYNTVGVGSFPLKSSIKSEAGGRIDDAQKTGLVPVKECSDMGVGSLPAWPVLASGQLPSAWQPNTPTCSMCNAELGKRHFRPRHHCRICGKCVCAACAPNFIALSNMKGPQRACTLCVSVNRTMASQANF